MRRLARSPWIRLNKDERDSPQSQTDPSLEKLLVTSRDSVSWRGSGDLFLIPVFSLPFLPRMQIFDYPLNELHRSLTHPFLC